MPYIIIKLPRIIYNSCTLIFFSIKEDITLKINPQMHKVNEIIDSTVTLDFELMFSCTILIIILLKLSEKI